MTPTPNRTRKQAPGFSIIELMVSISVIAILIGISFPFISAMTTGSRVQAGLNVAGMSSDVARQWVQAKAWANDGSTVGAINESYSGTAALYCPTGEIRIVINARNARNGAGLYLEDNGWNGYSDMPGVDYIQIPDGVGLAGIFRDGSAAGDVVFIAPPFAIAYSELGQLYFGDGNSYIYYDGNGDGEYRTGALASRQAGYNPSNWNEDEAAIAPDGVTLQLPQEAIECVAGIIVYSEKEFADSGYSFDGGGTVTLTSDAGQWLENNGQTIFFSPHTGIALRDEAQE